MTNFIIKHDNTYHKKGVLIMYCYNIIIIPMVHGSKINKNKCKSLYESFRFIIYLLDYMITLINYR